MLSVSNNQPLPFEWNPIPQPQPQPQPLQIPVNNFPAQEQSFSEQLNGYSETALDFLADFSERFSPSKPGTDFGAAPEVLEKTQFYSAIADTFDSVRGPISRFGIQAADAVFGVTSVLGQFSDEHKAGSTTYEKTMAAVSHSVLRSSINTAIGIGAGAAVAGLGIASAPAILIGGTIAIGAGFVMNEIIGSFSKP